MSKRRRNEKKSVSSNFAEAQKYVTEIMPKIKDMLNDNNVVYDESDNGTELSIDTTDKTYGEKVYEQIIDECGIPSKALSCLIDIKYSSISNRLFIRLKRK